MVAQVSKKQTEIKSAVVFRCTCKTSGEIFYAVPSDSTDETYKVTYNAQAHRYECNCPSHTECKHLRAVRSVVLAKAEIAKQGRCSPATAEYRVSCVHGVAGACWYPEYCKNGEWFRYPLEGTTHAVSFFDEAPARAWLADRLAAIAEQAAERKMDAFKRGMDEQYASDPRTELAKQIEARETNDSNLRAYYNGL